MPHIASRLHDLIARRHIGLRGTLALTFCAVFDGKNLHFGVRNEVVAVGVGVVKGGDFADKAHGLQIGAQGHAGKGRYSLYIKHSMAMVDSGAVRA